MPRRVKKDNDEREMFAEMIEKCEGMDLPYITKELPIEELPYWLLKI